MNIQRLVAIAAVIVCPVLAGTFPAVGTASNSCESDCLKLEFAMESTLLDRGAAEAQREPVPVLGSRQFVGRYGKGFGEVRPKQIDNGGVPSGWVHDIRWSRWGAPVARGFGRGHQYKPSGGYYRQHVQVRFKARKLGYCPGSRRWAYRQLVVRIQKKPGGGFGRWFLWSGAGSICSF